MKLKAQSLKLKGRTKRAHLSFLQCVGFPSLAQRTADNSPALQCWVGCGGELSPVRDDRNGSPTPLSSLTGLSDSPTAHPALKCWAIVDRPCGTAARPTDRCKILRCARAKLQSPRPARRDYRVYVFPREREPSLHSPRCRRTPKRLEGRAPAPRTRPTSAFTLNACSLELPLSFELYPLSFFPPAPVFPRPRTITPNHL